MPQHFLFVRLSLLRVILLGGSLFAALNHLQDFRVQALHEGMIQIRCYSQVTSVVTRKTASMTGMPPPTTRPVMTPMAKGKPMSAEQAM